MTDCLARGVWWVAAFLCIGTIGAAQVAVTPSAGVEASTKALGQTPRFEVISIKPNMSEDSTMQMDPPIGGRLAARNVSVNWLIKFAWKLRWDQISGGTGWIGSSKSDVDARAADPAAHEDQLRQMTRSLLAERFGLRVHPETRQQQIYTLILAKSNANAPTSGLHKSAGCGELAQSPAPDGPPPCPAFTMSAAGQLSARASTMNDLSRVLSDMTGRAVTDRTSLTGAWDFQVTWTPDGATSGANAPHPEDTGPSIFTALQGTAWAQAPVGTRTCGASGYRSGRKALGKLSGRKNCVYNLS